MSFRVIVIQSICFLPASLMLSACMVGPDFHSPPAPQTPTYIEGPAIKKTVASKGTAGQSQSFLLKEKIPAEWWRLFHSPTLNALVVAGLTNSPDISAAKAALMQAEANYLAQRGALYPTVTGNFSAERQRFGYSSLGTPGARGGSSTFNLFNTNISVSYMLDVFGGVRRQIEGAGAQVEYQEFDLQAALVTLSSNIATSAITIASLKAQIDAQNRLIAAQKKTLAIVNGQFQLGGVTRSDVLLEKNQLEQARAALIPLKQNLMISLHTLSTLIGELPHEDKLPRLRLEMLHLPTRIPLSCPSDLVRQRPDIRAAEALLHQACAQIGVTVANMLPQFNITGYYGKESNFLPGLFNGPNTIWNLMGAVAQPVFNGGTLKAQNKAAIAAFQQALAIYKKTVLRAFQNVADSLRALENDAQSLKDLRAAEASARQSFSLTQQQFRLGGTNYLSLLINERTYQQAVIARIQAEASRFTDTVALFEALGGGWWNKESCLCKNA